MINRYTRGSREIGVGGGVMDDSSGFLDVPRYHGHGGSVGSPGVPGRPILHTARYYFVSLPSLSLLILTPTLLTFSPPSRPSSPSLPSRSHLVCRPSPQHGHGSKIRKVRSGEGLKQIVFGQKNSHLVDTATQVSLFISLLYLFKSSTYLVSDGEQRINTNE